MERLVVRDYIHLSQLIDEAISRGGTESLNHLDIRAVKTLGHLFYDKAFNGDISAWDTSNVTDMSHMFFGSSFERSFCSRGIFVYF